ncbi:MAG: hypothetical protein K1Y36_13620 [Blastocatellia bacterium]|nr:hypothetical protein [Blastocatellia bacterium]
MKLPVFLLVLWCLGLSGIGVAQTVPARTKRQSGVETVPLIAFQEAKETREVITLESVEFETAAHRYVIDATGLGTQITQAGTKTITFQCPGFAGLTFRGMSFIQVENELLTVATLLSDKPDKGYSYEMTLWDVTKMTPKWTKPVLNPNGDTVHGGKSGAGLFFGTGDSMARFDWATGKKVWQQKLRPRDKLITASVSIGFTLKGTTVEFRWTINDLGHPLFVSRLNAETGQVLGTEKRKRSW